MKTVIVTFFVIVTFQKLSFGKEKKKKRITKNELETISKKRESRFYIKIITVETVIKI